MASLDDEEEPKKLFTLMDIKDDETSKKAVEAKKRLRFTNIHSLINPEEKLFLITVCDHFEVHYDELIEYIKSVGEMRNKGIMLHHQHYKAFMHTLKMFYYTDKGWRFEVEFEEFFCGYLRQFKEVIIAKMRVAWDIAKKQRAEKSPIVVDGSP